jgi:hypothetical protein
MDQEIAEAIKQAKEDAIKEFLQSPEFAQKYRAIEDGNVEYEAMEKQLKTVIKAVDKLGKQVQKITLKTNPDSSYEYEPLA